MTTDTVAAAITDAEIARALPFLDGYTPGNLFSDRTMARQRQLDHHPLIQAFAQHRSVEVLPADIAATQMPTAEQDTGLYEQALQAIQTAVVEGRVCDDVAWFSNIETLYDFIESVLRPSQPAVVADLLPATSTGD